MTQPTTPPVQNPLVIPGPTALSAFRLEKRLRLLQKKHPKVHALSARYLHFFSLRSPPSSDQGHHPSRPLPDGPRPEPDVAQGGGELRLWVVPRLGTVSPWSTKATEIA